MTSHKRVLVLNGFGNNLGDQAIFTGFIEAFGQATEAAEVEVALDQSFIYDFPFRQSTIETLNAEYDLIVLGGGGFIYHRDHDQTASGWGFDIPEPLIRSLTTPFAVYATGYNYRAYADSHFPAHTASHVRETIRRAAHFSVREHGSVAMLQKEFGVRDEIDIVPDCALHLQPSRAHLPELRRDSRPVGLCLRLDKAQERFGEPFGPRFEYFIANLLESLRALVAEGRQIVFTPHLLTQTDIEVGQLLKASLPEGSVILLHEHIPSLYTSASLELPSVLAAVYRQLDVVIGQRLHSVVIPFAVGTPVVSMSSTASNGWMQDELGVSRDFHIDLCELETAFTAQALTEKVQRLSREREEWRHSAFLRRSELLRVAREKTLALVHKTLAPSAMAPLETPSSARPNLRLAAS
ncbi:MAG: polysaccharide pyruvyl transferase family protein [Sandaracinaceae bacterium]